MIGTTHTLALRDALGGKNVVAFYNALMVALNKAADNFTYAALQPGDTDFAKGELKMVNELIFELERLMADPSSQGEDG